MDTTSPADLERRKQVRILLRPDLGIEPQKYEGRTYFVLKDPVSLRYYRLKENEHFLLQFLDGKHTLEDAQKAYEKRYRPDRLKLEDLEGFAQQLLTAGLAQNESPKAGKQLFDRRKKRRRTEWLQTLTNILYIKLPVFDPDRLLVRMIRFTGWIFTGWFFTLSVGFMLAAIALVATHFETFRSKLPDYHEFFSFKTVVYLWVALGAVKIIHEFGHGLSCKRFGGEVHEMGFLLLCFSPALYCNVSDAWVLPNKWHRIIISSAGIYVELIIAAIATFVWWNTPTQPFLNNLSLSLMIVCSVSTVVFNANPLMRYDGYYVLADWLEIPNLRERSNRFLKNLVLEHCLGVEVQPEGYMELGRKLLFVTYAITSYIYRWVITFVILYFFDTFLRPYGLQVISHMLAAAAAASMVCWPTFRLFKNIHRRGRLPDMKRWRVVVSGSVLAALLLFVALVPLPISRVRGVGLVQADPDALAQVVLRRSGYLKELKVRPGDHVFAGQTLAVFTDPDLEDQLASAVTDRDNQQVHLDLLADQLRAPSTQPQDLPKLNMDYAGVHGKLIEARAKVGSLEALRGQLTLVTPRDGVIGQAPRPDEVGKFIEAPKDQSQATPLFTVITPGQLRVCLPVPTPDYNRLREDLETPSASARKTNRMLRRRVRVSYQDTPLEAVFADLRKQVKGLPIKLDPDARLENLRVSYSANDVRLFRALSAMLGKYGLGYVVVSDPSSEHDGWVLVREGRERGVPEGVRALSDLGVTIRVHGRDASTWRGKIVRLEESEARTVPLALSSKAGGPVPVKATGAVQGAPVPQTQHYLVYVDIVDPDAAIAPGTMAQVKVHCRPETCLHWVWRKVNDIFDLRLL